MSGIPGPLLSELKHTLRDCGPFGSHRELLAVFTDERISAWRSVVPEAHNMGVRVDFFVDVFYDRYDSNAQSVLLLFLQVLYDQQAGLNREDECAKRLFDLTVEMAGADSTFLPPLARTNLLRAAMAQSGVAPSSRVAGYLEPTPATESAPFSVQLPPELSTVKFTARLESLKNKQRAEWLPVTFLEKGFLAARSVGRVEYQGHKLGTAFLVASDLVLTSAHVVEKVSELKKGGIRFNIGLDVPEQWRYFDEEVVRSSIKELDFSLLRLQSPIENATVALSDEWAYSDQYANILQHPYGGLMQVALRYNTIVHADNTRFYYVADTEEGSSGAPIFNDGWQVIGLHRAGIVDGDSRPVKYANQGVPLLAIKPHIQPYL